MTEQSAGQRVMLFRDAAGDLCLIPEAVLQQGRVSAEQKAEIELLFAQTAQETEVSGYADGMSAERAVYLGTLLILSGQAPLGNNLLQAGFKAAASGPTTTVSSW